MTDNIDEDIDTIYDCIDDLLLEGRFDIVDRILKEVDILEPTDILIAYLVITYAAKNKLKERASFFNECKAMISMSGEDPNILNGLE